ncbi:hypothetical protein [Microbulbifer mangrovi]|uniref:hypothetical protein n=1 Tax=Microbulbifer mangrovi TaxID=927787 RepID=UPI00117EFA4F|nr:hypothetical protein [Microbulbifer mangrovi]
MSHPYQKAISFISLAKQSLSNIRLLRDAHEGEDIFILGTGPSLSDFDFAVCEKKAVLLLNNAIDVHRRLPASTSKYIVISDFLRMSELRAKILSENIKCFCTTDKIFSSGVDVNMYASPCNFIMPKYDYSTTGEGLHMTVSDAPRVETNIENGVYLGKSVVFPAIQIAAYLGAKRIHLVGVDMTSNTGAYFNPSIKGNWSKFCYKTDAKPHFKYIRELFNATGLEIFDHSEKGLNDQIVKARANFFSGHEASVVCENGSNENVKSANSSSINTGEVV